MAWKTVEVADQRIRFVIAASGSLRSMTDLCAEFGISRTTGYVWLGRYRAGGVAGVCERSRRPLSSPARTKSEIEERIVALRAERPDWGARKLAFLLGQEGVRTPPVTVHRVLVRRGLVREEDRVQQATRRFERERPNQMWQMDFKSPKGWGKDVGPLAVIDDASRYLIALEGTWSTGWEAVRDGLKSAFDRCGMPQEMLMDHGIPWWNQQALGGWTQLSVWLMKQDIQLHFSGIRHPQTQGKVERFNGALEMARRRRGLPDPAQYQPWLDNFRHEYNHLRPHEALQMRTPASLWLPSPRSYQPHPPEWQYPHGAELYRLERTGQLKLDGKRWQVCGPLAGEQVQITRIEQRALVFYRRTLIREIDFSSQTSTAVQPHRKKTTAEPASDHRKRNSA
jgi:transposase InsO family protein